MRHPPGHPPAIGLPGRRETDSFSSPVMEGQRVFSDEHWLAHTWSRDGTRIFAIRETEDLRLTLVSLDTHSGAVRVIADLGSSPPVNNPVKGLSVSGDGLRFVTSVVNLRGDLWTAANVKWRTASPAWWRWFRAP